MFLLQTAGLFILTALAEIVGCFLPYLWLRKDGSIWLLVPAALSLAIFSWLLTLHPAASGRVYAAYGGVYVATALVWLKVVDGEDLSIFDWTGAGIAVVRYGSNRLWLERQGVKRMTQCPPIKTSFRTELITEHFNYALRTFG